jgi:hypothetical protein
VLNSARLIVSTRKPSSRRASPNASAVGCSITSRQLNPLIGCTTASTRCSSPASYSVATGRVPFGPGFSSG